MESRECNLKICMLKIRSHSLFQRFFFSQTETVVFTIIRRKQCFSVYSDLQWIWHNHEMPPWFSLRWHWIFISFKQDPLWIILRDSLVQTEEAMSLHPVRFWHINVCQFYFWSWSTISKLNFSPASNVVSRSSKLCSTLKSLLTFKLSCKEFFL